jgi:hypothetical protein
MEDFTTCSTRNESRIRGGARSATGYRIHYARAKGDYMQMPEQFSGELKEG